MKIEKVNESQIRCTLSKADLQNREIKLSELIYGSEKTKDLFRDMMTQASEEFGFHANDIPLMIEAVPLDTGSILLIITKVTDPEELDTRFSNFSPTIKNQSSNSEHADDSEENLVENPEVQELFRKIKELSNEAHSKEEDKTEEKNTTKQKKDDLPLANSKKDSISCAYAFKSINILIKVAQQLNDSYHGINSLYKNTADNIYYLVLYSKPEEANDFKKLSALLSEYGELKPSSYGCTARIEEHNDLLIKENALHQLM